MVALVALVPLLPPTLLLLELPPPLLLVLVLPPPLPPAPEGAEEHANTVAPAKQVETSAHVARLEIDMVAAMLKCGLIDVNERSPRIIESGQP